MRIRIRKICRYFILAIVFIFVLQLFHRQLKFISTDGISEMDEERNSAYEKNPDNILGPNSPVDNNLVPPEKKIVINTNNSKWFNNGIIYNRVPKCGSSTFGGVIMNLQRRNKFQFIASKDYDHERIPAEKQAELANELLGQTGPFMYNRHLHFVDFSVLGLPMPKYINMIRHPIDRFASHYSYQRQLLQDNIVKSNDKVRLPLNDCVKQLGPNCFSPGQYLIIPYFCGQAEICKSNTAEALELAKSNIDRHYAAVGVLEEFEQYLKLLECILPSYFNGAHSVYRKNPRKANKTKMKEELTQESREILERTMSLEIELYSHIRRRFSDLERQHSTCLQSVK